MQGKSIFVALALSTVLTSSALRAQAPAANALPEWHDSASVYLRTQPSATPLSPTAPAETQSIHTADTQPIAASPQPRYDAAVQQVAHQVTEPADSNVPERRLPPPTNRINELAPSSNPSHAATHSISNLGIPWNSIVGTLAALGIVIGLFLILIWGLRRGARRPIAKLPASIVGVLGSIRLTPKQDAQLIRVGNKLVLVAMTPTGTEPITEVTDPAEVDRLVGLCEQLNPHSTTKAFDQVFQQFSNEPAPAGFLGQDAAMGLGPMPSAYEARRMYGKGAAHA